MENSKKADALIIGFGKGGKTLAGALAAAGKTVILAEESPNMYGGTCINVACIPTKSLVHSAELSAAKGGTFDDKALRYYTAIRDKNALTGMLRGKNYHKIADNPNVEVIDGKAAFTGPHSAQIVRPDGSKIQVEAKKMYINTGAQSFVPPIPGLKDSNNVYVSDALLELTELPKELVIIGGGYIGLEFASMYTNFGSHVTIIEGGSAFIPREDEAIAKAVYDSLTARGVSILLDTKTDKVYDQDGRGVVVITNQEGTQTLPADAILVATGRTPNTKTLNAEAAEVELTERGAVKTDTHLKTTNPDVHAMGDAAGGLQFTYISLDDFRIVKDDVLGEGKRTTENRGEVPYSVFLDPPFSRVGLTEKQAREAGYNVKVAELPAAAIPKAQVLKKTDGLLKAVINADNDEILGAHIFSAESHEIINLLKLAMDAHIPYTVLRDNIYTHPTMTEGLNDLFATVK